MKNKINKIDKIKRIQQRQITITEYFGGVYEFDGIAWNLEAKGKEADELFSAWRKGLLKENSNFDNRKPKILEEN